MSSISVITSESESPVPRGDPSDIGPSSKGTVQSVSVLLRLIGRPALLSRFLIEVRTQVVMRLFVHGPWESNGSDVILITTFCCQTSHRKKKWPCVRHILPFIFFVSANSC